MPDNAFIAEARRRKAAEKARNMRYRRPMLAEMGWYEIENELNDIEEECGNVHWFLDNDEDSLVAALDGDEDEAYEFRMTFADIEGKCEMLRSAINEISECCESDEYLEDLFNTCTVALIGNRYKLLGYDDLEEDYFSLCAYEENLATDEAGKRLMRMTKAQMISTIGQCFGILLAFADLRTQYDKLSGAMAILRQENVTILDTVKKINEAYERHCDKWGGDEEFTRLTNNLPDWAWIS